MNFKLATRAVWIPALLCAWIVPAQAEPHPGLYAAMREVNHALYLLRHRTDNDFHGHKAAAIRLLERARHQLMLADRSDR
ncbi:MAG TPA: hypothetical protein VFN52_05400 [Acidiferrobacteraceae bacterium]|nr:hypothetical protein [Acidiferrobacteraceae bacterium]